MTADSDMATPRPGGALVVVGDLLEDVVVSAPRIRVGTDNAATIVRRQGGSAATVAVAAAHAGARVRFVGRVGDDLVGEHLVGELVAAGVEASVEVGGRTGSVVVIVDGAGERTMFPDRAAAGELSELSDAQLAEASVIHVPLYGLATPTMAATLLDAAPRIGAAGIVVSIDASAVSLIDELGRDRLDSLLERMRPTVLFANDDEATALGLADRLPAPGSFFVVKHGPEPTEVIFADGSRHLARPRPLEAVPDTTGAGDAFAAGFLAAWLAGADPRRAAEAANDSAGTFLATRASSASDRSRGPDG